MSDASNPTPPVRVLTLTPFYPAADQPALGCFVAEPLQWAVADPQPGAPEVQSAVIAVQSWAEARRRGQRQPTEEYPCKWMSYPSLPTRWGLPSAGPGLSLALGALESRWQSEMARPQLIHAHAALPCGHAALTLARKLQIPFVVTVHGLDAYAMQQVSGWPGRLCGGLSERVYEAASAVICVSRAVEAQVRAGAETEVRTRVIYNGADEYRFVPGPEPATPVVLTVGNLIPIKGHERVIRAVAALRERFPSLRLDVIGEGGERANLERLAAACGCPARFLGAQSRDEVAVHMQNCTVFALPSRYEALGCVYLEAMLCGKPVIACAGQGIGEVISNGVNGLLIPVEDPRDEALIATLDGLLSHAGERRRLGDAARATVLGGFTVRQQAQRLAQLYGEVRDDWARRGTEAGA